MMSRLKRNSMPMRLTENMAGKRLNTAHDLLRRRQRMKLRKPSWAWYGRKDGRQGIRQGVLVTKQLSQILHDSHQAILVLEAIVVRVSPELQRQIAGSFLLMIEDSCRAARALDGLLRRETNR